MAEYIEREAALKAIAEDKIEMTPELIAIGRAIGTYTAEQAFDGINQACDRHIESIKILPAADVQPMKHGQWIDGDYRCVTAVCSKCKHLRLGNGAKFATRIALYCEHCGARMDGES